MKMHQKKLRRFNVYSKIANVFFVLFLIMGCIGLATLLATEIILVTKDIEVAELLQNFMSKFVPDVRLPIDRVPHVIIFIIIGYVASAIAFTAYILKTVSNLFKNIVKEKTPFKERTIKLLKHLGIAFFVFTGVTFILSLIMGVIVNSSLVGAGITSNIEINFSTILYGLLLLSLAEIFEFGASLQNDNESIV